MIKDLGFSNALFTVAGGAFHKYNILKHEFCSIPLWFVFSVSCLFSAVKNKDVQCKFNQVYCLAGTEWSRNCSQYQPNDMTNDHQINIGSKDFVIETRTLNMMRIVDIFLLMMTINWGPLSKCTHKKISRFCRTKHSILHQIGKSKKLNKWVLHKLNKTKKIYHYEICSAHFCATEMCHFLIASWYVTKIDPIWQLTAFCAVSGLRWITKTFSQTKVASKEVYGHTLVVGKWNHSLKHLESWWSYYYY